MHGQQNIKQLKKEQRYTSTPPLGLRGLFYGELYLHLYLYILAVTLRSLDTNLQ